MKCKRILAAAMAVVLAFALSVSVFAAEEEPREIAVELNGQTLTFNDFAPELDAESGRTFLPFRQVFEALGCAAEDIVWDKDTQTATAVRGDTTIVLTLGSAEAKVTVGDVEQTVTMDVAPYMQTDANGGGYIYVPVRFAAQALGCNVGWDAASRTAIIVDVDALMNTAVADNTFDVMNKLLAYVGQFREGNWSISGTMTMDVTVLGGQVIAMDADVSGLTAGADQMQMTVGMDMDMSGLVALMEQLAGEAAAADTPSAMQLEMEIRGDLGAGLLYMYMGEELNTMMGLPADAWISMDLGALYGQMGMDLNSLMAATQLTDMTSVLKLILSSIPLDQAGTAYAGMRAIAEGVVTYLADGAFDKNAAGYTTAIEFAQGENKIQAELQIDTSPAGVVRGYAVTMDGVADLSGVEGMDAVEAQLGASIDSMTVKVEAAVNADNEETMTMTFGLGGLLTMTVDATVDYEATTEEPVTAPADDATVVDYFEMIAGAVAAEDPAPEPTALPEALA